MMARENLPHIGNWKCIKFVLPRIMLNKTQDLTFLVDICMRGTLRMSNFKTLSVYICSWTPIQLPKMASDLFYGEIFKTKLKV
jgi:hypothetical protein